MAEQQEQTDKIMQHFDGPTVAVITFFSSLGLAFLMWLIPTLVKGKRLRARQQAAMPGAYLLPMYVHPNTRSTSLPVLHPYTTTMHAHPEMPPPACEGDDSTLYGLASITPPPHAYSAVPSEQAHVDEESDYEIYVWGSVQHRTSRRGRRVHPAHRRQNTHESASESVATLPRYEEPPSYKSDNGFQNAT